MTFVLCMLTYIKLINITVYAFVWYSLLHHGNKFWKMIPFHVLIVKCSITLFVLKWHSFPPHNINMTSLCTKISQEHIYCLSSIICLLIPKWTSSILNTCYLFVIMSSVYVKNLKAIIRGVIFLWIILQTHPKVPYYTYKIVHFGEP